MDPNNERQALLLAEQALTCLTSSGGRDPDLPGARGALLAIIDRARALLARVDEQTPPECGAR